MEILYILFVVFDYSRRKNVWQQEMRVRTREDVVWREHNTTQCQIFRCMRDAAVIWSCVLISQGDVHRRKPTASLTA